ncbi:MAG: hypothetical protein U0R18_11075 [Mycobacterium sp.]
MNTIARRIAAAATVTIAPALIAIGVAGTSHAETTVTNNGNYVTVPTNTKLPTEPGTPHFRKPNRHHAQGQYR